MGLEAYLVDLPNDLFALEPRWAPAKVLGKCGTNLRGRYDSVVVVVEETELLA